MGIFKPTAMRGRRYRADPRFFVTAGARAVLLDVDNTIASYTSHEPIEGAVQWAQNMVEAGFRVMIVSNNFKKRVEPFARRFGLDCISFAMKPLPCGYLAARKRLQVPAGMRHHRGSDFYRCDRRKPLRDEICSAYADRAGRRDHLQNAQALRTGSPGKIS